MSELFLQIRIKPCSCYFVYNDKKLKIQRLRFSAKEENFSDNNQI